MALADQAHLLGVSMGAAIAQQFVLDHPERVKSLILVSTFSHIDVHLHKAFIKLRKSLDRGGYSTFFDEVVKLAFNPDFREDTFTPLALSEQIHQSIQSSQWKIVEGVGHNIYIEKPSVLAQIVLEFLGRQ
jgi:pimeloyl-ACP methyl ester carboxylesterase